MPFDHNLTTMFFFAECFTSLYCGINRHCCIVYSQLFHINGILWIQLLYSIRIYITWSFSSSYFWRVSLEFLPLTAEWQKMDNASHCRKIYLLDPLINNDLSVGQILFYPVDSAHAIQHCNHQGQVFKGWTSISTGQISFQWIYSTVGFP